ncbi:hypothetical protein, partial [Thermogutta sp.]|uniref:hypothetical protein n=1 Tax=Thermogutta sp. TaxID=1962930 RepID=UPI003C7DFE07
MKKLVLGVFVAVFGATGAAAESPSGVPACLPCRNLVVNSGFTGWSEKGPPHWEVWEPSLPGTA